MEAAQQTAVSAFAASAASGRMRRTGRVRPQPPPRQTQTGPAGAALHHSSRRLQRHRQCRRLTERLLTRKLRRITSSTNRFLQGAHRQLPLTEEAIERAEGLKAARISRRLLHHRTGGLRRGPAAVAGETQLRNEIIRTAERFIGVPYKWGGESTVSGFDCSGLTMVVYQLNGLDLPRTSSEQWTAGRSVGEKEPLKGDLVFFATHGGAEVSHVGIYLGGDAFLHAPRRGNAIQVASLSGDYYRARYLGARSYF